jgi:hypothetical protein
MLIINWNRKKILIFVYVCLFFVFLSMFSYLLIMSLFLHFVVVLFFHDAFIYTFNSKVSTDFPKIKRERSYNIKNNYSLYFNLSNLMVISPSDLQIPVIVCRKGA